MLKIFLKFKGEKVIKFFKLYLDFLRNLTIQATMFAVAVIVAVESHLDIGRIDLSNIKNSAIFVGLIVMTVVAVVGNVIVFIDEVLEPRLDEDEKRSIHQENGVKKLIALVIVLYKNHKFFCTTVCFSWVAIIYGVVVIWFAGMPLMAGIYNAIHAK